MDIIKYPTTRSKLAFLIIITCFFIQAYAESRMPIIDAAKALFSLPTAYDCWIQKVRALFFRIGNPYFPPPTSFGGREDERTGKQGTTDKFKEAAVKSLDKSKATVEDSAKAAARLAEEAVDKTVKKLKRTLSTANQNREAEL
ncbi:hypothetical protein CASFOL_038452 [Castilleja foliolosa]|uniref:Uncharacterized protein n=1 Tax=Castilleja foliolosa TaxID=1961234 RepID=A0ABD3BM87_9LAMI